MPAPQRQPDAGVIQLLLDEPYRFEFFQAVRVIELWLRRHGVMHDRALLDFVRFQNSAALGFPASQLEALSAHGEGRIDCAAALLDALDGQRLRQIRIRPAFMGFLGTHGALPLHYSERILAHEFAEKDEGPRAFFDLFSNRALALFYQAWGKYRLEYKLDHDGNDGFLPMLLAFAGVEPRAASAQVDEDDIGDQALAHFAAQIRSRVVSAAVLGGVLSEYFQVPIRIEQFAGEWDVLAARQRTRLGGSNCCLGAGATVGERIWRHDLGIRVCVGPVARAEFERFLPGSAGARALAKMIAMFVTGAPHREVQLVLRAQDVQGVRLGGDARLGFDSFMAAEREAVDRGDVCFRLGA
jgi:type VI secretion system protein ImpH